MAFFFDYLGIYEHFLIYSRQLTMWIILLISPTPGGSGIAEFIFKTLVDDYWFNWQHYALLGWF